MITGKTADSKTPEAVSDSGQGKTKGEFFKNRQAALQWLQQRGQVSRSKFYDDCNAGLITIQPDKSLSKFEVALYAEKLFTATRQAAGSGTLAMQRETDEARKIRAEAEIKEMQAEAARREHDGKWQLRREAEDHEIALFKLLQNIFRQRVYLDHTALLLAAGGRASNSPEFITALMTFVDSTFNQLVSQDEYDVEFDSDPL